MNVNGNNFGPRSAMGTNNALNLQNLQKTDKSGLVGNAQEATAADNRPEGETEVNKSIVIYHDGDQFFVRHINDGKEIFMHVSCGQVVSVFDANEDQEARDAYDYYNSLEDGKIY